LREDGWVLSGEDGAGGAEEARGLDARGEACALRRKELLDGSDDRNGAHLAKGARKGVAEDGIGAQEEIFREVFGGDGASDFASFVELGGRVWRGGRCIRVVWDAGEELLQESRFRDGGPPAGRVQFKAFRARLRCGTRRVICPLERGDFRVVVARERGGPDFVVA
jgi:hypothetical protein